MKSSTKCGICNSDNLEEILKTKPLPISTRYLSNQKKKEFLKPMKMGLCQGCGLFQIINPVYYGELVPLYDWINYNEPEDHLDKVCSVIREIKGVGKELCFAGLTYKDDTTLARLKKMNAFDVWRIDPLKDLNITERNHNIESIQEKVSYIDEKKLLKEYKKADIMLVRHILEHTHHTKLFSNSLKKMVNSDALLVFEVPDCTEALKHNDYTTLWEEHRYYFTPETFLRSLEILGYEIVKFECYKYPHENSLVAFVYPSETIKSTYLRKSSIGNELEVATKFAKNIYKQKNILHKNLKKILSKNGKISIFGAGHLSSMFINIMDCASEIECVIDDDPNKQNLFMPGSRVKILDSTSLYNNDISLCLTAVSPASEEKIRSNNKDFVSGGGIFTSIFPQSQNNIFNII